MIINIYEQKRSTLIAFADAHKLIMEIHERNPKDVSKQREIDYRYYARFKGCEIKSGAFLVSIYGNGATPAIAMRNYAREISGRHIVIDAMTEFRRETAVPLLVQE